jgi:hypothetical protein
MIRRGDSRLMGITRGQRVYEHSDTVDSLTTREWHKERRAYLWKW